MEILITIFIVTLAAITLYKSFHKATKGGCSCSDKNESKCYGCSANKNSDESIKIIQ